jgi:hypothetical protein
MGTVPTTDEPDGSADAGSAAPKQRTSGTSRFAQLLVDDFSHPDTRRKVLAALIVAAILAIGGFGRDAIGNWIRPATRSHTNSSVAINSALGTPTPSTGTPVSGPVYVADLLLTPPPDGKGQAVINGKPYDHSVWYDVRNSMQIVIPLGGKYRLLKVAIGTTNGWWSWYDIQADGYTLVGRQDLPWNAPAEPQKLDISGRQSVTVDVEVQQGGMVTVVLGDAQLT